MRADDALPSGRVKMPLGTPIRKTRWRSEAVRRDPGNGRPLAGISRARASPRSTLREVVTADNRDLPPLFPVNRLTAERSVRVLPARGVRLQDCARRPAPLLRIRLRPGSQREPQVHRAAQSRWRARRGMPLRRPPSVLSEAAPVQGLPAPPSSTVPERREPEPVAPPLQLHHRSRRAAVGDTHPDFWPRRHRAKAGQSPPPQFAPQQYAPMPVLDGAVRQRLGDFWGRA